MIGHKLPNKTKSATVAEPKLFHQLNNPFVRSDWSPWCKCPSNSSKMKVPFIHSLGEIDPIYILRNHLTQFGLHRIAFSPYREHVYPCTLASSLAREECSWCHTGPMGQYVSVYSNVSECIYICVYRIGCSVKKDRRIDRIVVYVMLLMIEEGRGVNNII
jgi:hypothetical protein